MPSGNKSKLINDPLHGFVTLPSALVYDVVQHPYFQRLRRIRQLGMSEWVYPGATHTRFHHALGAMNLMVKALDTLRGKGVEITDEEKEAAILGILMHDIGHGPYSHTLEYTLAQGVNHEDISIMLMERMNIEFGGALRLAIDIFRGDYHKKPFLHQLISGELDMDRLDYLMRDSFYTGVSEGIVGVDRLIHMLNVKGGDLGLLLCAVMWFPEIKLGLLFIPIPIPGWIFCILFNLGSIIFSQTADRQRISHEGHLGGALFGGVIGYALINLFANTSISTGSIQKIPFETWALFWFGVIPILLFGVLSWIRPQWLYRK